MSPAPRPDGPDRVLKAAVQSLATNGYAGTTARSIAAIGGFAPGVIYYYFTDLDDVLVATTRHASDEREARYREALDGVTSATQLVRRLRGLYDEDTALGHIEAIQELVSAARPGSALGAEVSSQTKRWEALAEEVVRTVVRGSPLARLVRAATVARAAVAYYMGMQTLTYLDGDAERPRAAFAQAARLAAAFDKLPKLRRAARGLAGGASGKIERHDGADH